MSATFELFPMRRRSWNNNPQQYSSVQFGQQAQLPGSDYFLSSKTSCSDLRFAVNAKPFVPASSNYTYSAVPVLPKAYTDTTRAHRQESSYLNIPTPILKSHAVKQPVPTEVRRCVSAPSLKSCMAKKETIQRRKSVQFFGMVQVQYTHHPADYDRSTIECPATTNSPVDPIDMSEPEEECPDVIIPGEPGFDSDSSVSDSSSEDESEKEPEIINITVEPKIILPTFVAKTELPKKESRKNRRKNNLVAVY
ncbi:hypothetical protein HK098_000870 [Nowakowskiella sp. JEL0407]|nr:hypothetical protein HK098_000870 [Nowakowskiella sp. JEL0407]